MSEFAIYSVDVGKGLLALSPCPGQDDDYARDLEMIRMWRPSFVVSLTAMDELDRLGARQLAADIPTLGARWLHFPVEDFGVPSAGTMPAWQAISEKCLKALSGGGRILVHCRGGCGRSGMAALRLMVEMGEPVTDALARLRYVRYCAVETDAQYDWASEGALTASDEQSLG